MIVLNQNNVTRRMKLNARQQRKLAAQEAARRNVGGQLLPGAGRAGAHESRRNPSAKTQRQDFRRTMSRAEW